MSRANRSDLQYNFVTKCYFGKIHFQLHTLSYARPVADAISLIILSIHSKLMRVTLKT